LPVYINYRLVKLLLLLIIIKLTFIAHLNKNNLAKNRVTEKCRVERGKTQ